MQFSLFAYQKPRSVHREGGNFGVKHEKREGSQPVINATPSHAIILTAESAAIIGTICRDSPASTLLLFATIDPPGSGIVCAGVWGRTEPPTVVCWTLKINQIRGKCIVTKSSRHLGVRRVRFYAGCLCPGAAFRVRFED
jgi:hypothetical protein